uniref:microsomal glutathione S-transferase 3-like n=1 Tax=Styela clava TaxID=7725 RepID=UPI0019394384|nr:microsomal glutathione S-transferase 3-like [Styela clava]
MGGIEFLTPDHGYALMVILYTNIMLIYLVMQVGKMRKKYEVKYPDMYSDKDPIFNCYQRAHHNTLEALPMFYSVFVPVAFVFPKIASILGAVWVTSRFSYAWGYYTGDPKKRLNGNYGVFGLLGLLLMLVYITVSQFGILPI